MREDEILEINEQEVENFLSSVEVITAFQQKQEAVQQKQDTKIFPAMTQDDKMEVLQDLTSTEARVFAQAQKEYASQENIFVNFNRTAKRFDISPEKVLMVYAIKHVDGILSWVNGHELQREEIEGRIEDLRIYMALLWLMVKARKAGKLTQYPEGINES